MKQDWAFFSLHPSSFMLDVMRHWFAHPHLLWSLTALPALALLALWARRRRWRARAQLGSFHLLAAQAALPRWPRWLRGLSLTLGLALAAVGAAGPQWGRDWDVSAAPGRDLVVVVDCSRSMLAETPSRLQRARDALVDLAAAVEKRGGHRLALVVFAGRARLACPLTHDYDHFRDTLAQLEDAPFEADLQPPPGASSGTRLGEGVLRAAATHDPRFSGRQDILLLSDGDDPGRDADVQQSRGIDAAQKLAIPVYTVGLGDPYVASPIRLPDGPLTFAGQEVTTRLHEAPLKEIAERTGGTYTPAHTGELALGQLYLSAIADRSVREESDDALPGYRQHYALFLLPAFGLLASALTLSDGPRWRRARSEEGDKR
jgi:Ca-activated chloride channel family protein